MKILDFGISRILDDDAARLTQSQSCFGTPLYMSPEQMLSPKDTDERTDIWALGVILYELITGAPPFDSETFAGISIAIASAEPKPMSALCAEVPPGLDAIVARTLAKDMQERFSSVLELADALTPFAEGRVCATITSPLGTPITMPNNGVALAHTVAAPAAPKPARRGVHPAVWVGVAAAIVGGGVVYAATQWGAEPGATSTAPPASATATTTATAEPEATATTVTSSAAPSPEASDAPPPDTSAPPSAAPRRPRPHWTRPPPPTPKPSPPAPNRPRIPKFNE